MSGESLTQPELDAKIAQAEASGFTVERANDTTLLLDLDNEAAMNAYKRVMPAVAQHFGAYEAERWKSKSGNTHIRVKLGYALSWELRYALQSALGSDGMRDVLAIAQMQNGCDEASLLFRPKEQVEEDIAF